MSAKKKAKKRLPKPVPCEWWGIYTPGGRLMATRMELDIANIAAEAMAGRVARVRITPVAKRRKGAK